MSFTQIKKRCVKAFFPSAAGWQEVWLMLACQWRWYWTPHLRHCLSWQRQSHLGSIKIQEAQGRRRGRPGSQVGLSPETPSLILRLWHIQSWLAQPSIWKLKRNLSAFITRCSDLIVISRFNAISMSADGRRVPPWFSVTASKYYRVCVFLRLHHIPHKRHSIANID